MRRIAFFVPHGGCPQQCSFCNQRTISGVGDLPTPKEVEQVLIVAQAQLGERVAETQIAFFGGSFTAIDQRVRTPLLEVAAKFCRAGGFGGIRCSTRPDAISEAVLEQLKSYPVVEIELGAQSMDDRVLEKSRRGHTAQQVAEASRLILERGIGLTLQMMTGLPGDSPEGALETARKLADLSPGGVRIYPTLVLRGTLLEEEYHRGDYQPQSLEEAVELGSQLLEFFGKRKIPVIRMGLHSEEGLEGQLVAGPYHSAFRELCEGYGYYEKAKELLDAPGETRRVIKVAPREISKLVGHGGWVLEKLAADGWLVTAQTDPKLRQGQLELRE